MPTKSKSISPRRPAAKKRQPVIELVPATFDLKTILVPTDFSKSSLNALRYAAAFSRQTGATLILAHVVPLKLFPIDYFITPAPDEDENLLRQAKAREKLEEWAAEIARETGVATRPVVAVGSAVEEICAMATREKADLVIIATHGASSMRAALIGSVAERVIRHATRPVLVVRGPGQALLK
jgi:nucleotide-binding universal stress UspA family protein